METHNWTVYAAGLALIALTCLLFLYAYRGERAQQRNWLTSGAISLELLAAGMAVFWAARQGISILTAFFILGFVGLALSKAVTVASLVKAWNTQRRFAVIVAIVTMTGIYVTVYTAGSFEGTLDTAGKHAEAAAASAPVQAVEAQLEQARAELSRLSGYADAGRAQRDATRTESARQAASDRMSRVSRDLAAARAELAACPHNYITKCIKPAQSKIARLQAELDGINAPGESEYAAMHAQYSGLKKHVAELETQRAGLLTDGAATGAAIGADDRLVAWLLGYDDVAQAAGVKWLFFVLVFDLLSLGLRLLAETLEGEDVAGDIARQAKSLAEAGFSREQVGLFMSGNTQLQPAAAVPAGNTSDLPSYDKGGRIPQDMAARVHAGEGVLNPGAMAEFDERHPGEFDALNAKHDPAKAHTDPAFSVIPDTSQCDKSQCDKSHSDISQCDISQCDSKPAKQGLQTLSCQHCGKEFKQRTVWQKFCSEDCRNEHNNFVPRKRRRKA